MNHYTSHLSSNHREARRDKRTVSDRARVFDGCIRRHVLIVAGTVWAAGEQSSWPRRTHCVNPELRTVFFAVDKEMQDIAQL